MPSRTSKLKSAVPFDPAGIAANPYIQRLIQDAKLRANMQQAFDSTRKAYVRLSNGKAPGRALLEDKKLQNELRQAIESLRDASIALSEAPKQQGRKKRHFGRRVLIVMLAAGLALAGSEKLRSKVLDTLFGAEEEFEYTPPPPPPPAPTTPASPVSSA